VTTSWGDPYADWLGGDGLDAFQTAPLNTFSFGPYSRLPSSQNPFGDFLEEEPEIPFQGALRRANLTPNQFATFRNQRQNIFNQFLAKLDDQLQQGVLPEDRFSDFVNQFDFTKEFQRFAPGQRAGGGLGGGFGLFAPPRRLR